MIEGAIDVRTDLYRNSRGGPRRSVALGRKRGLIVHWYGNTVPADDRTALVDASSYHALKKDWSPEQGIQHGDGLMYHVAVGQDGALYWTRDLEAVLWHCGAWPENEIALAVLVLCAANRPPTARQYVGLRTVVEWWRTSGHTDRAGVKGHLEVSANDCPGPDLLRWVRAYRQEADVPADPMEATYQAHAGQFGAKRYAGHVDRPYWQGDVLICEGAVIRADGAVLATGRGAVDDLETYWREHGVLTRYGGG